MMSLAKSNKGEEKREERKSERSENKCRSWGHFISGGWQKKGGEKPDWENCKKVPWGIWKKINKDHDDNQDDQTGDTSAPRIFSLYVKNINQTDAEIVILTNEKAVVKIDYGTTNTYGSTTTKTTDFKSSNMIKLTGLVANTTYHYKVTVEDKSGNIKISGDRMFKTDATTDTTDPIISNINASAITQTGATVVWQTNENTRSTIYWSTATPINELTAFKNIDTVLKTDNTYNITGLVANSIYYFKIVSIDVSGNTTNSVVGTITTLN